MLRLLVRRIRVQWPLLAALLVVVTIGALVLGVCALLVTRTADRALEVVAARATPDDVDATAYTVTVRGPDAASVAADTRGVLTEALAPFPTTTSARASSVVRSLPDHAGDPGGAAPAAETYLSAMDGLAGRAVLVTGRWPAVTTGPLETVVLESTARTLGLEVGSRVRLGAELQAEPAPPLEVIVVGVARPVAGTGWDRDPLNGSGFDLAYEDGRSTEPVRAYGPFIVDLDALFASGSTIDRLEVTASPDLSRAARPDLDAAARALSGADRRLARVLGDRVRIQRVEAGLPATMRQAHEQQRVVFAAVLAVAVLGGVLAAAALALASRLTASMRTGETALLAALGVSRRQFLAAAAVEAGALAALAAAVAVPASSTVYSGLTRLSPLTDAGLTVGFTVTAGQVAAAVGGALALAILLTVLALRPAPADRRHRREPLARSGADVLLVAFAVAGWWQLTAQPTGSGIRTDLVRVAAPALLLTAGVAVALRLVGPALRGVDRVARRARGLVVPLAAFEAARRPNAVAAGLLIGLAGAAATFGVALDATWQRSQRDQADLSVGTDLAVTVATSPATGDGAALGAATGGTVSPAVDRGIAVGQWIGRAGDPPRLVALDTARAGSLLRGRLDGGRDWAGVGAALAPPAPVTGLSVPAGAVLTISGTATGPTPLTVTPRLLLQDATGTRTSCPVDPIRLDGAAHQIRDCAPVDGLRVVAVALPISGGDPETPPSHVSVTLTVPGAAPGPVWTVTSAPPTPEQLDGASVALTATAAGAALTTAADVEFAGVEDAARTLVATAFADPGVVPVAVSARFAAELGIGRGAQLSFAVGTTPVTATVVEVLPVVPAAPGAAALLADLDTLSRALVVGGNLDFPMDAWWVGDPVGPDAVGRATALRLGPVTSRAGESARLVGSPPRAALPAALRLLVPVAGLLLVAGVVLHVTCDLQLRAVEVARLRGIGLSRRDIRTVLLGQHTAVLVPLLVAGAAVGALATHLVAPLMVRSMTGAAPVPAVVPRWPWGTEGGLLAVLLVGCALAVTAVVTVQARRADAAHLRLTS